MTEIILLNILLGIAFILAPLMTNRFFLNNSKVYSDIHKVSLIIIALGAALNLHYLAGIWPLFCILGFLLYLKNEYRIIFSIKGLATCIPFVFSVISSVWFFAGVNDLHLLGYNRTWSFYAALHGSFLGWMFVGCLAFLSKKSKSGHLYSSGCYLIFVFFLFVAFGIDGTPYIKQIGVVGLSLLVPLLIGIYAFNLKKKDLCSRYFSVLSLFAIAVSMTLAMLNEFWTGTPRIAFGIPMMVLVHGFINATLTIPAFFLAIWLEYRTSAKWIAQNNIIFFDGFCVLCNGTVALLIKIDKNRILKYSSLQGTYAQEVLELRPVKTSESVIFYTEGASYEKAEAVIHILIKLGGLYKALGNLLNLFPLFILNGLYDFIAHNRYHFFGKNESCSIPKEEDKKLFLP